MSDASGRRLIPANNADDKKRSSAPPAKNDRLRHPLPKLSLTVGIANHEKGDFQSVTYCINCRSENQVFQALMSMSGHNQQIRLEFPGRLNDLRSWRICMPDYSFSVDSLGFQRIDN